jgi:hypothetical protein
LLSACNNENFIVIPAKAGIHFDSALCSSIQAMEAREARSRWMISHSAVEKRLQRSLE